MLFLFFYLLIQIHAFFIILQPISPYDNSFLLPRLLSFILNRFNLDKKKSQKVVTCVLEGIMEGIPALSELLQKVVGDLPQFPVVS